MKNLSFAFVIFITSSVSSQSYMISESFYTIVYTSISISYTEDDSYDVFPSERYLLETRQGKYDYYHKMIENAWGDLKRFGCINKYNAADLIAKNIAVENDLANNNHYNHIDLSVNGNWAINYASWITDVLNYPSIKAERKLLIHIYYVLYKLESDYPTEYYNQTKYKEMYELIQELETCPQYKIATLGSSYGL